MFELTKSESPDLPKGRMDTQLIRPSGLIDHMQEMYLARLVDEYGEWDGRDEEDAGGVVVVLVVIPQDHAEHLEHIEGVQHL